MIDDNLDFKKKSKLVNKNLENDDLLSDSSEYTSHNGLNTSFLIDQVMANNGLRPLDMKSLIHNNRYQPLNIISCSELKTTVFNQLESSSSSFSSDSGDNDNNNDFFTVHHPVKGPLNPVTSTPQSDKRGLNSGFFNCLAAR